MFVCYMNKTLGMSFMVKASTFKHEDQYQQFHKDFLYFCNWSGEVIPLQTGHALYAAL